MKTIIGYTDSVNECGCCGKTDLKGTFCIDLDGTEVYYGSVCAKKNFDTTDDEQKAAILKFKNESKLVIMASDATNDFRKLNVLKFIEKKKLDLKSFLEKNGTIFEETKFYIAYTYAGCKVHIISK